MKTRIISKFTLCDGRTLYLPFHEIRTIEEFRWEPHYNPEYKSGEARIQTDSRDWIVRESAAEVVRKMKLYAEDFAV